MLTSIISGFFFLLFAVCLGPAMLIAGYQMLMGQKVRLPSVVKPLSKMLVALTSSLFATAGVVANMVAERLPPKYAHLQPIARPVVKFVIAVTIVWLAVTSLLSFADR